ncbi:hypothetical protein CROQUDRAFT_85459 [Cronartium quercuum f. sp. fusiforme G11]|uniref:Uncharacterized protein n=1 Tax=Cronartium quercuum f. sp. fusiforme G11 TaxID=708437 RepID=A0A9P6NS25_9BASI|nr:hypothetical protein CROQUDRAFT_85459 [Cronartium quercuum f. sp. fusiforme G11]
MPISVWKAGSRMDERGKAAYAISSTKLDWNFEIAQLSGDVQAAKFILLPLSITSPIPRWIPCTSRCIALTILPVWFTLAFLQVMSAQKCPESVPGRYKIWTQQVDVEPPLPPALEIRFSPVLQSCPEWTRPRGHNRETTPGKSGYIDPAPPGPELPSSSFFDGSFPSSRVRERDERVEKWLTCPLLQRGPECMSGPGAPIYLRHPPSFQTDDWHRLQLLHSDLEQIEPAMSLRSAFNGRLTPFRSIQSISFDYNVGELTPTERIPPNTNKYFSY